MINILNEKYNEIQKALQALEEVINKDKIAWMEYEAREAALLDERTRLKCAREKGIKKGIEEGIKEGREKGIKKGTEEGREEGREEWRKEARIVVAKKLIKSRLLDIKGIVEATGLSESEVNKLFEDEA